MRRGDVLIENFKPGTMDDLGLGWETLRDVNPRLIYCAISGFGATGPYRERAGYDAIMQGFTGLMSITGESDGAPVKVGVALIDVITALYAHGAILAALRHRERTGQGQYLELSLMECGIAALINAATAYLVGGEVQGRWGSAHPSLVPYQAFRARDGYLMVGAGNERLWKAFCEVLGTPEWADDPRYGSNARRVACRTELVREIEARLQARDRDEWVARFAEAGLPAGPINDIGQVFEDPQVRHREMAVEVDHPTAGRVRLPGIPVKFGGTPAAVQGPPPNLGQHTDEVLRDVLGLSTAAIAELRASGALGDAGRGLRRGGSRWPSKRLIVERADGYAVVTLNRPPANTISAQLVLELESAVDELARDDAVRAIVLTGSGTGSSAAGRISRAPSAERHRPGGLPAPGSGAPPAHRAAPQAGRSRRSRDTRRAAAARSRWPVTSA